MPRRLGAILAVAFGVSLSVIDGTVANVALPTIGQQLGISAADSIWIVNAYQLAIMVSLLSLSALGDVVGYRKVYIGGLMLFTVASVGCSLSGSLQALVLARVMQGFGAAAVTSVNTTLIRIIYPKAQLGREDLSALEKGLPNLLHHVNTIRNTFHLPCVVAINAFPTDTPEEQAYVEQVCAEQGVPCVLSEVFAKGGEGGKALAEKVLEIMEDRPIQYTYPLDMPLKDKVKAIAKKIYRADDANFSAAASKTLAELTEMGYGDLPVCIAKTQYSFSDNAKLTGAPTGFTMEVREVRLAAGAGFVVVICGSIMTMPGLPKKPAAVGIDVDADGKITGLF